MPKHLRERVAEIKGQLPPRPSLAEWAPHIGYLSELGYSDQEINAAFGWEPSARYLRKIKAFGRMDGQATVRVEPSPVPSDKLAPEFQAMLEFTPEAFIAFYDYFNYEPMPEHCKKWVHEAFEDPFLLLNVPPRHNKSTLFSIWWPVWNLVRDRDWQGLIVSLTDTLSTRWVGYIASILAYGDIPETFGRFKPEKQDGEIPWRPSRGELMILGRHKKDRRAGAAMQFSILARGSGSQILGFEADGIVIDDVTERKIAVSEIQRQQQIDWLHENVLTRGNPEVRVVCIGQRVHLHDIYGYLSEQVWETGPMKDEPIWRTITFPAVLKWPEEEDGRDAEVLWPEVWTYERLMTRYALVGGKQTFYTMYQQDPVAADATLVREEWLEACRDPHRAVGSGLVPEEAGDEFLPVVRVASLDPSPTQFNGLIVADVVSTRDKFAAVLVDIMSFKTERQGELLDKIRDVIAKYHPTYFVFEKNIAQYWARGDPFIEELKQKCRVLEHTTSASSKYDTEMGLESLSFDFETGAIRMPYADDFSRQASRLLENEARMWTREGRLRDDVLMALWFIKFNWKRLRPLYALPTHFRGGAPTEHPYRIRLREGLDIKAEFRRQRDKAKRKRTSDGG